MEVQSQFIEMLSHSGYEEKSLGELCDKITDGSHNPPKGNDGSEYLMISSKNIFIDGLDLADVRHLSKEEFDLENKRTEVKKNDILLTIVGTIGRTYLVKGNEGNIVMQRSVAVLKPSDKVNPLFMMYSLHTDENLEKEGRGNAQKGVYLKQLSQFKIKVPSLDVQERFCTIYQQADKSKFVGFKSQFIEMFGSISDNNFKFPSKRLGDVCRVINGRAYSAKELLSEGKYRVLRVGNFFSNETWYYSDLELESDKYCNTGDLLFAWSCTLGPKIWTDEKAIFHYHIWKLADYGEKLDKVFFNEQLKQIADKMKHETHGSTMVHLTKNQFESISLIIPPLEAQERFVSIVHQADKSKYYNQVA